ncbi:MAG TPA: nucleotidyltransferase family protein [Thermoleophilaceae bacterium]
MPRSETMQAIAESMKKAAAALREDEIPFLLAGSLASWARGGPETSHDLDFVVKPEDAERALEALAKAGMRTEKPPEEWLYKAWDGDVLVDVIFNPSGITPDDDVMARGDVLSVMSMELNVMAIEDVLATKLNALTQHSLRYEGLLDIARALREQIDWDAVRQRARDTPFARAFFVMIDGLGIAPLPEGEPGGGGLGGGAPSGGGDGRVRVDVTTA